MARVNSVIPDSKVNSEQSAGVSGRSISTASVAFLALAPPLLPLITFLATADFGLSNGSVVILLLISCEIILLALSTLDNRQVEKK